MCTLTPLTDPIDDTLPISKMNKFRILITFCMCLLVLTALTAVKDRLGTNVTRDLLPRKSSNDHSFGVRVVGENLPENAFSASNLSTDLLIQRFKDAHSSRMSALDKKVKCAELIRVLAARVGVEETIRVICEVVEPGTDRIALIKEAFESSQEELGSLVSFASEHKDDSDYKLAFCGIFSQTLERQGAAGFLELMKMNLPPEVLDSMWASVVVYVGTNQDAAIGLARFEELKMLVCKVPENLREEYMQTILAAGSKRFPFSTWEGLREFESSIDRSNKMTKWNELVNSIAKEMVIEDPGRALSLFNSNDSILNSNRSVLIPEGAKNWARVSNNAAEGWYVENARNLPSDVADGVKSAFLSLDMERGEIERAWKWFNQIADVEIRKEAAVDLGSCAAKNNLQGALDSSKSLKGDERDYYLTGVLSVARTKDVAAAIDLISNETPSEIMMASAMYRNEVAWAAQSYATMSIDNARAWVSGLPEVKQIPATRGLASVWARKDPASLAEWLNTLSSGSVRDMGIRSLVDVIKKSDSATAEKWLKSMSEQP